MGCGRVQCCSLLQQYKTCVGCRKGLPAQSATAQPLWERQPLCPHCCIACVVLYVHRVQLRICMSAHGGCLLHPPLHGETQQSGLSAQRGTTFGIITDAS